MLTLTHIPDITNITFDREIYYSKDVNFFTDIAEITPIPTDYIIYKTVTGIGATHSEIVAKRHSIIVLPHISIVTSKHEHYKEKNIETFAIYGDVDVRAVYDYLTNDSDYAKILTTPKGLNKIIKVMRVFEENVDYKKFFFLLIDECHKLVQDATYRTDMVELMEHFFEFEQKAMISATPIPPSDSRFKEKKFKQIRVCPDYPYQQPIDVVPTNSLVNALGEYFETSQAECYCIFFNSVEGIKSLIRQLNIQSDYVIFCSKESSELLKLSDEPHVSNTISGFKRYNFFTSSFFNGLDIHMDIQPDILILTDYGYRDHTLLDPYTDILQIMGRFRRTKEQKQNGELAYRKAIHINNARHFTNPITQQEALLKIDHSKIIYDHLLTLKQSLYDSTFVELLKQQLKTVKPYGKLLKANDDFSHFLKDNYLDDERVKAYYKSPAALLNAYTQTRLYDVKPVKHKTYNKEDLIKLQKKSLRYSVAMNKLMAGHLLELEDYKGLDVYYEQQAEIEKLSPVIFNAYNRLGYEKISELKFRIKLIRTELLKLDIDQGLNLFPLIDMVHKAFRLNVRYTVSEVKKELLKIFEEFNIVYKAKSTDVLRYFEYKEVKKDDERAYVFTAQKLYTVGSKQHV